VRLKLDTVSVFKASIRYFNPTRVRLKQSFSCFGRMVFWALQPHKGASETSDGAVVAGDGDVLQPHKGASET